MTNHLGLSRRQFLQAATAAGLTTVAGSKLQAATPKPKAKAVIQICLLGGPSQLDTWDPKPNAPAEVRGPYHSIQTRVPGIRLAENFPRLAQMAERFALLRTIYHKEAPIHETGLQLTQTGRLFAGGKDWPHYGETISALPSVGQKHANQWIAMPKSLRRGCAGMDISPGQRPDCLEEECGGWDHGYLATVREGLYEKFGRNPLGAHLLAAFSSIQFCSLFPVVTVNMFDSVFGQTTWDCHANGGDLNTTLADYGRSLCPMLDQALSALLKVLEETGLLDETLVVCLGEFGRTPKINRNGGRDHWPGCWSGLMAGGGIKGGQVIGQSDARAAEPKDRPIHAAEIVATVYQAFGIDPRTPLPGRNEALIEAEPILELF